MSQESSPSPATGPLAERQPAASRALRSLLTLGLLAAALYLAQQARVAMGLEWSPESIRETVRSYGIWAPAIYLCLTAGRQLLALPSMVVLTAAGLLFGAGIGTLLGGFGITLNALVLYGAARGTGRHWLQPWLHRRWPTFEARARSAGPAYVALMTGHPAGVLTPFHLAAGLTGVALPLFVLAVLPAALLRAGLYALLGAHLLDVGSTGFWVATGALALLALAPLAHPGLRRRLFALPDALL